MKRLNSATKTVFISMTLWFIVLAIIGKITWDQFVNAFLIILWSYYWTKTWRALEQTNKNLDK